MWILIDGHYAALGWPTFLAARIEGDSYRVRESEQGAAATPEEEMSEPPYPAADFAAIVTLYLELPDTPLCVPLFRPMACPLLS